MGISTGFLFSIHLASCLFMTGVIWIVQLVHYPSFRFVDTSKFLEFNQFHQASITYVVLPAMVVELATGILLLIQNSDDWRYLVLFLMIVAIWGTTFFLSVPLHSKLLGNGFDYETIEKLVSTNWPRTILWSLRSCFLLLIVGTYVR